MRRVRKIMSFQSGSYNLNLTFLFGAIISVTHAMPALARQDAPLPHDEENQRLAAISQLLGGANRTDPIVDQQSDMRFASLSESDESITSTIFIDPAETLDWDMGYHGVEIMPDGLIYPSYLAGVRESRFASAWMYEKDQGWIWDIALGGRTGLVRWGATDNCESVRPEGWQLDIEGAGMPRLDLENDRDLAAVDFRFGVPLTYGCGSYQTKFAYYHLSSHLGDERMVRNNSLLRRNYARDVLVWGHSYYINHDVRLYGEVGWAFYALDGAKPWECQFGVDYSPAGSYGAYGSPFFALNGHLREDVDFGGSMVVQTGWQWRGVNDHLFRAGMEYFNGMSEQYEFFDEHEEKVGFGIWYDF